MTLLAPPPKQRNGAGILIIGQHTAHLVRFELPRASHKFYGGVCHPHHRSKSAEQGTCLMMQSDQ